MTRPELVRLFANQLRICGIWRVRIVAGHLQMMTGVKGVEPRVVVSIRDHNSNPREVDWFAVPTSSYDDEFLWRQTPQGERDKIRPVDLCLFECDAFQAKVLIVIIDQEAVRTHAPGSVLG